MEFIITNIDEISFFILSAIVFIQDHSISKLNRRIDQFEKNLYQK